MLRLTALSAQAPLLALSLFIGPDTNCFSVLCCKILLHQPVMWISCSGRSDVLFHISFELEAHVSSPCSSRSSNWIQCWSTGGVSKTKQSFLVNDKSWDQIHHVFPNELSNTLFWILPMLGLNLKFANPADMIGQRRTWAYPETDLQTFFTIMLWSLSIPY